MQKNPNHKEEKRVKKEKPCQSIKIYNGDLIVQNPKENFLELKNNLIFFQDKSKVDEFQKDIEDDLRFLKIKEEVDKEEVLKKGVDMCILADVSESMHPWRIFLKKSMYFALMDLESFIFSIPDVKSEDFSRFRVSLVTYTDRKQEKPVKVLDFVEYSSLGEICKMIDDIDIKQFANQKRAVFDGFKAVCDLKWNEDAQKIIVHYAADPAYGNKYSTNIKGQAEGYDPYPEGTDDIDEGDILEKISDLDCIFNFIKLGEKLEKYQKEISGSINMDICKPKVDKI